MPEIHGELLQPPGVGSFQGCAVERVEDLPLLCAEGMGVGQPEIPGAAQAMVTLTGQLSMFGSPDLVDSVAEVRGDVVLVEADRVACLPAGRSA